MGYFKEVPNLEYQSFLKDKISSQDYLVVKNFFRRVKLRDDLDSIFTLFTKYTINDGLRPDNVAEQLYGNPELDWVVLITAGIINVKNEWPLRTDELYRYSERKYGLDYINAARHYETELVKDSRGRMILPRGLIVDANFTIPDPSNSSATLNPVVPVTNFQYETRENDKKRQIYVLKNAYLPDFLSDTRQLMLYTESSEYINELLIRTENTEVKSP